MLPRLSSLAVRVKAALGLSWSMSLDGWPYLWQWMGNGSNRAFECGETCCAMVVNWFAGEQVVTPDQVTATILGPNGKGPTNWDQLSSCLTSQEITNTICRPTTKSGLLWFVWHYLTLDRPCLVLRYWRWPNDTYLHWIVVCGMTNTTVTIANPEPLNPDGSIIQNPTPAQLQQTLTYDQFWALCNVATAQNIGSCVLIGIEA